MVEQAFIISKDSELYRKYFDALAEKQKFHDLAREFFRKHDLVQSGGYYQAEYLALQLSDEQREKYSSQLKKLIDSNNMSYFKKNSPMCKEWVETVVNEVSMKVLGCNDFWYFPYIGTGRHALWNKGDVLYGYLMDSDRDKIELSESMSPIKMSEYYSAKESL
jgi:hypothetical protein